MRVLSLFSGIGAHDLGLEWAGYKIVGQIEIDEYCQKVLKKHWPKVPKWRDITRVTATDIRRRCGRIDLITGGFPCQDISTAGKQAGLIEGNRSSLYWEMWRLIRELRPPWLLLENVPALRTNGADNVLASLEALGYTCWPLVVGAVHAGAPHERKRVWIVGYHESQRCNAWRTQSKGFKRALSSNGASDAMAKSDNTYKATKSELERKAAEGELNSSGSELDNAASEGSRDGCTGGAEPEHPGSCISNNLFISRRHLPGFAFPSRPGEPQHEWEPPRIKPRLGRGADGTSRRLDKARLKAIGNANPPQIPYLIGLAILEASK